MFNAGTRLLSCLAIVSLLAACGSSGGSAGDDGGPPPGSIDAGGDGGAGNTDAAPLPDASANPNNPNNANLDTDCDGLSDQEEFGSIFPGGLKTDPNNPDSDGDGIPDGVELGRTTSPDPNCTNFVGDADPSTTTIPTQADSDADLVPDGVEDANQDGSFDNGETNPNSPDTDGDSLQDGVEDANQNGTVDTDETDPRNPDTDEDFIGDGTELNVTNTDPLDEDSDDDSCEDGQEDTNQNGVVDNGETDPNVQDCGASFQPDNDNDGIPNDVEDANGNGTFDQGETDLNNPDTDCDGLDDGVEDADQNGSVGVGETDPRRRDTDCDGLIDGPDDAAVPAECSGTSNAGALGEDQNANGSVDVGETDPLLFDTDSDGILDGVERGETVNPDPTNCTNFIPDSDPTTTTDPTDDDSDDDGIVDGAEDADQDGEVDGGELDPEDGTDGTGPAGQVCVTAALRPIVQAAQLDPDLRVGIPDTFLEIAPMVVGGETRGITGYDSTNQVAFIAYRIAAPGGATNPTDDEANLRPSINALGTLSNPTTQTFTTWDAYPALQGLYDQAGSADLKTHVNSLAESLVGTGAGVLSGTAGVTGPFKVQAEYVHRSNNSVVVVIAVTTQVLFDEPAIFTMDDTAGGSGLAQSIDTTAIQCEVFEPGSGRVDFIFSVDDSGSMGPLQADLANTATAISTALGNSSIDWRIAMVTSAYHRNTSTNNSTTTSNRRVIRGFTRNINEFRAWLTEDSTCQANNTCSGVTPAPPCNSVRYPGGGGLNGGCWIGIDGSGSEGVLGGARRAVDDLAPATASEMDTRIRAGAQVVVIILGDADDQTEDNDSSDGGCDDAGCEDIDNFITFFNNTSGAGANPLGIQIKVHGIICPEGFNCPGVPLSPGEGNFNEYQADPRRIPQLITATGGIRGDVAGRRISDGVIVDSAASIATASAAIIDDAIAQAGYTLLKPPIGASIKVAMDDVVNSGNCDPNDIPRSRVDGFDFNGVNGTLSFFGDCRPSNAAGTREAAVSYRYWVDQSANPDGDPPPCENDPFFDPTDPDFCLDNRQCNTNTNECECPNDCGGTAPAGFICDNNIAVCEFVCSPDCGGTCGGFTECNTNSCACECVQSASCGVGFAFDNSPGVCDCVCDEGALGCPAGFGADLDSCSCECLPDCGGCADGTTCNQSTCFCEEDNVID